MKTAGEKMKTNDITVEDCLKAAMAALLRGDTAERDRLCELAEFGFDGQNVVPADKSIFETKGDAH